MKEIMNCMNIKELQKECHEIAKSKGFWETDRDEAIIIALIHSELSEALDYLRHGNKQSDHIPEFLGVEEEYADTMIRIFDICERKKYRLEDAILAKMKFNKEREYKHGKQF